MVGEWANGYPDTEEMLEVANVFLYLESAVNARLLPVEANTGDKAAVVADGLLQQAKVILFTEARANLSLAKRAVTSYIESNFDPEHIANVAPCLHAVRGAFSMLNLENAVELMNRCAECIANEYEKRESTEVEALETLADALVTTEYLLDELAAGREVGPELDKLLVANLAALS